MSHYVAKLSIKPKLGKFNNIFFFLFLIDNKECAVFICFHLLLWILCAIEILNSYSLTGFSFCLSIFFNRNHTKCYGVYIEGSYIWKIYWIFMWHYPCQFSAQYFKFFLKLTGLVKVVETFWKSRLQDMKLYWEIRFLK